MRNQASLSFLLLITFTFTFIFIFIVTPIAQGDTVKTAIIADSHEADKLVDIIIPKMSKITGIELLERQRIKSVLQEHKLQATGLTAGEMVDLNKILHADIFAIINSGGSKALPVSLRIFDARNGFIIDDKALPSGNLTAQTDYIVKELEKSLKSIKIRKTPIAVLAIRNAGITKPSFYNCIKLTAQINRNIAASPDIMMLERTNLEMVNRERKVTEKIFTLKNAAILLDFEFLPMDIPDKIQMRIHILDRKGKIQKVFNYKNVTHNNSLAKTAANDIISNLKAGPGKIASSSKQEARRFYQEFKYIHKIDFEAARRKISAAIALTPENLDYRRDFAYLLMNEAKKKIRTHNNNDKYLQMLYKGLQILYEIRKFSPNYHPNNLFSNESHVFTTFANHYNNRKVPKNLLNMQPYSAMVN